MADIPLSSIQVGDVSGSVGGFLLISYQNHITADNTTISTTSPGYVFPISGTSYTKENTIAGASVGASDHRITLPAGTYTFHGVCECSVATGSSSVRAAFRLNYVSGAIPKTLSSYVSTGTVSAVTSVGSFTLSSTSVVMLSIIAPVASHRVNIQPYNSSYGSGAVFMFIKVA